MTPRPMKTADGTRVQTYPHGTNNTPNFGGKDGFNDVGYERRTFAHQDRILKILDDNDLWQYMDEPGEMMRRYTAIRKADPDMPLLVQLVKLSVAGKLPVFSTHVSTMLCHWSYSRGRSPAQSRRSRV